MKSGNPIRIVSNGEFNDLILKAQSKRLDIPLNLEMTANINKYKRILKPEVNTTLTSKRPSHQI